MVGSINAPTSGNTFDKFQANAMANGTDPTKVGVRPFSLSTLRAFLNTN